MKTAKELRQEREEQINKAKGLVEKAKFALDEYSDNWSVMFDEVFRDILEEARSAMTRVVVIDEVLEK